MRGTIGRFAVLGLMVAACLGGGGPSPAGTGAGSPTVGPAPTSAETEAASLAPTAHPGAGIADPAGRIAFGRIVREDPFYGQVVALYAIDPDGSDEVQLTDGGSGFPAWSPDGSRLAFTQRQDDGTWQIATMAADGSDVRVLTDGLGGDNASWSADGTWIVYQKLATAPDDPDFHTAIWRMDADGSDQKPLGGQDAFDVEPKVSPDNTKVLFARLSFAAGEQRQQLVVRTIASENELVLEAAGSAVEHPAWSADGASIIYDISPAIGATVPNDQVMQIAADGSGAPVILFPATGDSGGFKPSYSPDGSRIVFGCFYDGASDALCTMNADGSDVVVVVDTSRHENHFSWGPPIPTGT